MATATPETPARSRDPILPMRSIVTDHMGVLSAWYLSPFYVESTVDQAYKVLEEPPVSRECRDYVLGLRDFDEKDARWARSELAEMRSLEGDTCNALRYMEAGNPSVREHAKRQGCTILQQVEGERGEGTLRIFPPTIEQCEFVVKEMKRRLPWVLAQLDARIDEAEGVASMTNEEGAEVRRQRRRARALQNLRQRLEVSVPESHELQAFFIRFERIRLEGTLDAKYKEQKSLEGRIDQFNQLEQQALAAARAGLEVTGG